MGIDMELVHPLLLDFGTLLRRLASIQPQTLVRSGTDVGQLGLLTVTWANMGKHPYGTFDTL